MASSAAMVLSDFAFSELKGLAGMACITKKVIAITKKMVSTAMPNRLIMYMRNFEFISAFLRIGSEPH